VAALTRPVREAASPPLAVELHRQGVAVPDETLLARDRAVGPLVHAPTERVVAIGGAAPVVPPYFAPVPDVDGALVFVNGPENANATCSDPHHASVEGRSRNLVVT
jgi:hypothetical protein